MKFRAFPHSVETVAAAAIEKPFLHEAFEQLGPASPTYDGAFLVALPAQNLRAFAKPARNYEQAWRAVVHEKLASDLAYDLNLPVPPVHVLKSPLGTEYPAWLAISHIPFPQPRPLGDWQAVGMPEAYWHRCQPVATAMRVFYTWIHDTDHGGHPQNVLFGDPGMSQYELAFIDHSLSLLHTGAVRTELAPPVHSLFANDDQDVVRMIVDRIEAIRQSRLEYLVSRLKPLMPEGTVAGLVNLLLEAQEALRRTVLKENG